MAVIVHSLIRPRANNGHTDEQFRNLIKEEFLNDDEEDEGEAGSSNALMIFPLVDGRPSYVSDYHMEGGHAFKGFNKYSISQLGQGELLFCLFEQMKNCILC
jgi:hypothetical protein